MKRFLLVFVFLLLCTPAWGSLLRYDFELTIDTINHKTPDSIEQLDIGDCTTGQYTVDFDVIPTFADGTHDALFNGFTGHINRFPSGYFGYHLCYFIMKNGNIEPMGFMGACHDYVLHLYPSVNRFMVQGTSLGDIKTFFEYTGTYNPIPEPATAFLFGFGLLGFARVNRKDI